MPKTIPDRWLDYKPIGKQIKGTRFIAFKVPLKPGVNEKIENVESRLQISQLLEQVPNLGLVIDLTFTTKYYNPTNFISEGVKHIKLMIPGHMVPEKRYVQQFANYVDEFLNNTENDGKLIGVHCTHGLNRTGYLICHYMISVLKIHPETAIEDFEEARGHKIERDNYRSSLISLNRGNQSAVNEGDGMDHYHGSYEPNRRYNGQFGRSSNRYGEGNQNNEHSRPISWRKPAPSSGNSTQSWRPHGSQRIAYNSEVPDYSAAPDRQFFNINSNEPSWMGSAVSHHVPGEASATSAYSRRGGRSHNNRNSRTFHNSRQRGGNRNFHNNSYGAEGPQDGNPSRLDLLPSNDFSSNYSVMGQLYNEDNPSNRYCWRRPQ